MAVTVEQPLANLEAEVSSLTSATAVPDIKQPVPWWEKARAAFQNDSIYAQIARLGAEYRQSQPIAGEEDQEENPSASIPS